MEATQEFQTRTRVNAKGELKGMAFSEKIGNIPIQTEKVYPVKVENLGGGRVRETAVSRVEMNPNDIPIAVEMMKKYGDLQKPEAQKEFFRRAKHWRNRQGQRSNKPEPKPQEPEAGESVARQFQIALADIAHGDFAILSDIRLRNCALLSALPRSARTFENFAQVLESLKGE